MKISKEKEEIRIRIDDLEMSLAQLGMIKPKLYYRLLPHWQGMRKELNPFWKKWFK